MSDMYDEKGLLKPEYVLSETQKKSMIINNDKQKIYKFIYPETRIDPCTDFGKCITFKSVDGKDWATYEDAMAYNQMYYEKMMIQSEENKGMRR